MALSSRFNSTNCNLCKRGIVTTTRGFPFQNNEFQACRGRRIRSDQITTAYADKSLLRRNCMDLQGPGTIHSNCGNSPTKEGCTVGFHSLRFSSRAKVWRQCVWLLIFLWKYAGGRLQFHMYCSNGMNNSTTRGAQMQHLEMDI